MRIRNTSTKNEENDTNPEKAGPVLLPSCLNVDLLTDFSLCSPTKVKDQ